MRCVIGGCVGGGVLDLNDWCVIIGGNREYIYIYTRDV